MASLDMPARRYKVVAGALMQRTRQLKPYGGLLRSSPLTVLVEREMLGLGVQGKLAMWRTLRVHADADPRLNAVQLDELIARAESQYREVESARIEAAGLAP